MNMKMDEEEKEIRRILQSVAEEKGYSQGHIIWIRNLMDKKVTQLQENLKTLLNVQDCTHDY